MKTESSIHQYLPQGERHGCAYMDFYPCFINNLSNEDNKFCIEVLVYSISFMDYVDLETFEYICKDENRGNLFHKWANDGTLDYIGYMFASISQIMEGIKSDAVISDWNGTVATLDII